MANVNTYSANDVNGIYQSVQFRDGPSATVASYVALLNMGALALRDVQQAIIGDAYTADYVNPVIRLYQAAFNRVPESSGENFWVDACAGGRLTLQDAARNFADSSEFQNQYHVNASAPINAVVLTAFYQNILGRAPDAAGYAFWLNSGQNVGQVLNFFAQSSEFKTSSAEFISNYQTAQINHTAPDGTVPLPYFTTVTPDPDPTPDPDTVPDPVPVPSPPADTTPPTAPTWVMLTPAGGTVMSDTVNSTNTHLDIGASIIAGEATGGHAEFYVGATKVGEDTTIASGDTTVTFTTSDGSPASGELQAAITSGGVVSVKLFDAAGNNATSTSNPTLTVDYLAPTAPTGVMLTPAGGTIVADTLNNTNTYLDIAATITAGEATGGYAEFYVGATKVGEDTSIASGDTAVTFTTSDGSPTSSELQAAIASGGVVSVKLFDAFGNNATSTSNPTLMVDYLAPVFSVMPMIASANTITLATIQSSAAQLLSGVTILDSALLPANTFGTLTVVDQGAVTAATIVVSDSGHSTTSTTTVDIGTIGADVLTGDSAANLIFGFAGADSIDGGDGADQISGDVGADTMIGGLGDDTFFVNGTSDIAVGESIDGTSGFDTIYATATTDLTGVTINNIDQIQIYNSQYVTFSGDQITGQTWQVNGYGGGANLIVNAASGTTVDLSQLSVSFVYAQLFGASGNETLTGTAGADIIGGDAGSNQLTGGLGADTFIISNSGGVFDNISDLARNDEADVIVNGANSRVTAFAQGNWVATVDTVNNNIAGATAFVIYADNAESIDLSSVSNLSAGGYQVLSSGTGAVTGSSYDDYLNFSGAGSASFTGGAGSDVFDANSSNVNSQLTIADLGLGGDGIYYRSGAQGNITATVSADWVGSSSTNKGSGIVSLTSGSAGVDIDVSLADSTNGWSISGSTGAEILVGDDYADTITGGSGADIVTGGMGADVFSIASGDSGLTDVSADTVTDFLTGTDQLKLSVAGTSSNFGTYGYSMTAGDDLSVALAIQVAVNNAQLGTSRNYVWVYDPNGGATGYLVADTNLDSAADYVIKFSGLNSHTSMVWSDIIV